MAEFDARKLTGFDWGIIGTGVAAFVFSLLAWRGASVSSRGLHLGGTYATVNAWNDGFAAWFGVLCLLAAAGLWLAVRGFGVRLPGTLGPALLMLALSAVGTLLVLLRLVTSFDSRGVVGITVHLSPRVGCYLALLAGLVQVGLAVLLFRYSGEALPGRAAPSAPPAA